jgi:branched-subunit amino acid ABC-type transport system permease component
VSRARDGGLLGLFGAMIGLQSLATLIWTTDSRSITVSYSNASVRFGGMTIPADYLVAAAAAAVILAVIFAALRYTMAGRAVQALAQDPESARILGVNVDRYAAAVFALGVAVAAMAGYCSPTSSRSRCRTRASGSPTHSSSCSWVGPAGSCTRSSAAWCSASRRRSSTRCCR